MGTSPAVPLELEGAYIPPQRITVASIYPLEMAVSISRRAPKSKFVVPAGTKDKPGILVVEDTWESGGTLDRPVNHRILAEATARHIVEDLTIRIFGISSADRAWPGVFLCAGPSPTAEEIADAEGCQRRYYGHLVNQARELERDKKRAEIRDRHRMAARELGIEGEEWIMNLSSDGKKKCAACAEFIDSAARKCPKCGEYQSPEDAQFFAGMRGVAGGQPAPAPKPVTPPVAQGKPQPAA